MPRWPRVAASDSHIGGSTQIAGLGNFAPQIGQGLCFNIHARATAALHSEPPKYKSGKVGFAATPDQWQLSHTKFSSCTSWCPAGVFSRTNRVQNFTAWPAL